ncbi:hypothetical protein Ocin01_07952 [Orchesella cincta]|uniref:Uncharacterized protein n=1 Tax=Orchesella cincta TaxID=48709 RepID=A0A1D2N0A8_ORCCI|nr:hypothetical protein Ocin01_07952 [Orchesella cincta]
MTIDGKKDNVYRTWLRYFGAADICLFPIAVVVIVYYFLQARTVINLWQEGPSDGTMEWFISLTPKYKPILYYTGNLENVTSRAAQLSGIYSGINERCGAWTKESVSGAQIYVALPAVINLVSHALTFTVGILIFHCTRNQSEASSCSLRLVLGLLILILLMETASCYLLKDARLCPVLSISNLVFIHATLFLILYRIPHLIAAHKYLQITAMSEYERKRIENTKTRKFNELSKSLIKSEDETSKMHVDIVVETAPENANTNDNLSDSLESNFDQGNNQDALAKKEDTHSSISDVTSQVNPIATKRNELNLAMKLDLTKEPREDESSITEDNEHEDGTSASVDTTSGATYNSSIEAIPSVEEVINSENITTEKEDPTIATPDTTTADVDPPPTSAYDASGEEKADSKPIPPTKPVTPVHRKQPVTLLPNDNSGISIIQRTSEIAPGRAAVHFTIIRPKTRRNVEEQGKSNLPTISSVVNIPRSRKNRKVSFSGGPNQRKKYQKTPVQESAKDEMKQ